MKKYSKPIVACVELVTEEAVLTACYHAPGLTHGCVAHGSGAPLLAIYGPASGDCNACHK